MDHRGSNHHAHHRSNQGRQPSKRNYKLLIDPVLVKGTTKVYRYEGVVENDPTYPPVYEARDPRKQRIWMKQETLDIPVPRFKIDSNYVGEPPPLEVTMFNINDNIDEQFLYSEIVNKHNCRDVEELRIFTHELSRKHLGVARVIFSEVETAKRCVQKLNKTTLMGKELNVFLDSFGKTCQERVSEIVQNLEEEMQREEQARVMRKRAAPPPPPSKIQENLDPPKPSPNADLRDKSRSVDPPSKPAESPTSHHVLKQPPPAAQVPPPHMYRDRNQPMYDYVDRHPHEQYQKPPTPGYHNYHQEYRGYSQPQLISGQQWENASNSIRSLQHPPDMQWAHHPHHMPMEQHAPMPPAPTIAHPPPLPHINAHHPHPPPPPNVPVHEPLPEPLNVWPMNYNNYTGKETLESNDLKDVATELQEPEIADPVKSESPEKDEKDGRDLDTRIALLLQNKDSGSAPPFLSFSMNSDDEDKKKGGDDFARDIKDEAESSQSGSSKSSSSSSSESDSGSSSSSSCCTSLSPGRKELDDSSKDGEEVPEEPPEPLSTPPSPFISKDQYLQWHRMSVEIKKAALYKEKMENRERLRKLRRKKMKKKEAKKEPSETQLNGDMDDAMSLSSLSSTENHVLQQPMKPEELPPMPPHLSIPPPPHFSAPPPAYHPSFGAPPPSYPPSYMPHGYLPSSHGEPYQQWQQNPPYPVNHMLYPGYSQPYVPYSDIPGYPHNAPPMGSAHPMPGAVPHYPSYQYPPCFSTSQPVEDAPSGGQYHDPTINEVLDRVIQELKMILKKDFNKRMIEGTAFRVYESWLGMQERKFKAESRESFSTTALHARTEKLSSISSLFDNKEGLGLESLGSVGLGFRAAMPKMPSFHKCVPKLKPSTPPHLEGEDSRDVPSDNDDTEMTKKAESSEYKKNEGTILPSLKPAEKSKRKIKSSSEESGQSDLSSDDDQKEEEMEEEEKESSHTSEGDSSEEMSSEIEEAEDSVKNLKEVHRIKEELAAHVQARIEDILRTPERDSRPPTPLPDADHDLDDVWLGENETEKDDVEVKMIECEEKKAAVFPSLKSKEKNEEKRGERRKASKRKNEAKSDVAWTELEVEVSENSVQTDTADEKSDSDLSKEAEAHVNGRPCSAASSSKGSVEEERSPVLMEHSYCLPWAPKEEIQKLHDHVPAPKEQPPQMNLSMDHDYTRPCTPPKREKKLLGSPLKGPRGKENRVRTPKDKLKYPSNYIPHKACFKPRNQMEEYNILYSFLIKGIDHEDIELLKKCYHNMLADDQQSYWLNDTHWVDHPAMDVTQPPRKRRKGDLPLHKTGSARTEGIYKVDSKHKQMHKFVFHQEAMQMQMEEAQQQSLAVLESSKSKLTPTQVNREARSIQRRLLTAFGSETDSDLLKFNQLKFRKKLLKFGKSSIHDWGLFAMEPIAADEMVIEYVGQSIRSIMADLREVQYEKSGIGSSYLFRIDKENIIDATKCGNLARFINHSCSPNCYAKIITVENRKKIVIYSKQPICCGEEITYDYKFPIEDEKIICLCGAPQCKGTLN